MARMGRFDARQLKEFQKKLEKLENPDAFVESCAKELAARLFRMVVQRTPVGKYGKSYVVDSEGNHVRYKSGKKKGKVKRATVKTGGTLRKGWTIGELKKEGTVFKIEIRNPTEYATYVEYGHRTPNQKGWVLGKFMMTLSEQELESITPRILEAKIKKYLEEGRK